MFDYVMPRLPRRRAFGIEMSEITVEVNGHVTAGNVRSSICVHVIDPQWRHIRKICASAPRRFTESLRADDAIMFNATLRCCCNTRVRCFAWSFRRWQSMKTRPRRSPRQNGSEITRGVPRKPVHTGEIQTARSKRVLSFRHAARCLCMAVSAVTLTRMLQRMRGGMVNQARR